MMVTWPDISRIGTTTVAKWRSGPDESVRVRDGSVDTSSPGLSTVPQNTKARRKLVGLRRAF
ncbi:MAG: hypothetical protein AB7O62_02830 [Pirellulales bacterium]